jgi:MFS transporter, putative metabolite:H+ symporter
LGLSAEQILTEGELIISMQMFGLLIGGIVWGIIGDKQGRLKVLFGSILLYSIANILNGFVDSVPQYIALRFIAGVGLAGELGAGITLVSELLPKEKRGVASAMIASFGILGAVTAFLLNKMFDWRTCYFIGGGLGFILLALRVSVQESEMFKNIESAKVERGNFLMFFTDRKRFVKYVRCILIGLPAWYLIGVLVTFSDQFAAEFGIQDVDPGKAIMFLYMAIAFGDLSGACLVSDCAVVVKHYLSFMALLFFLLLFSFYKTEEAQQRFIGFARDSVMELVSP